MASEVIIKLKPTNENFAVAPASEMLVESQYKLPH